jgi:hypothetical protein
VKLKRYQFDRLLMGDSYGRLVRVFEPRWWQLHRWLWWLLRSRKRAAGTVVIERPEGKFEVRVIAEDRVRLPRVPRAEP